MKNFRIAVMLNGAEGIDYFEKLSNLKQIASGLVSNQNQTVLYYNLATVNAAHNSLLRLVMHFTGNSYAYLLDSILSDVVKAITDGVNKQYIKEGTSVKISLFGFSEGATLARHFGMAFISSRLYGVLPKSIKSLDISFELEAEYLFDSIRLPTPIGVSVMNRFSLFNFQPSPYYQTNVPKGTKVYHAVSLDDCLVVQAPALIDKDDNVEEVWFASDHLGVGGGHILPYNNAPLAATDALQYIVMRAVQNGLQFNSEFLAMLNRHKDSLALREIHNQSQPNVHPQFRRVRDVVVKKQGSNSDDLPLIHETVIRRMEVDSEYRPLGLLTHPSIKILKKDGTKATVRLVESSPTDTSIVPQYKRTKAAASQRFTLSKTIPKTMPPPKKTAPSRGLKKGLPRPGRR